MLTLSKDMSGKCKIKACEALLYANELQYMFTCVCMCVHVSAYVCMCVHV
jgi:hypothetical protein